MELFSRLWLSANTKSVEQPPTDVFAALIDDLYAPLASFMIGATTAGSRHGAPAARGSRA
jgi:hypothetical protein